MPNNTTNILTVSGEAVDIDALLDLLVTSEGGSPKVDFNRVVPMAESLQVESGSLGERAYELLYSEGDEWKWMLSYQWVPDGVETREQLIEFMEKKHLLDRELGKVYRDNKQKYDHTTWYSWCVENWGTKWNAYGDIEVDRKDEDFVEIRFETAWSPPVPVYATLAEKFPDLNIAAYWSDEGSYGRSQVF